MLITLLLGVLNQMLQKPGGHPFASGGVCGAHGFEFTMLVRQTLQCGATE
ncbi:hypothetical protein [Vibrio vulnificus YJ016]|uniref:Uncharacterized protein n=1 Tax=Vibrio vulnificus (strain YJ016) TaxID=196600 RepID=Q7MCF6_VIBVY|nr:hypothetical protein [Vibrio vulnificus YJ016]